MIICIQMDRTTKDILDQMVGEGHYRDFSEAISVAVANQLLLHRLSLGSPSHIEPTVMISAGLEHPSISKSNVRVEAATRNNGIFRCVIPTLFQRPADPNADLSPLRCPTTHSYQVCPCLWTGGCLASIISFFLRKPTYGHYVTSYSEI